MSYVDPPTAVSDTIATAADFNILADDIRDLDARADASTYQGVYLRRTTNQSIPNMSWTAISWSSGAPDLGNWWTSGANITVPAGAIPSGFTTIVVRVDVLLNYFANGVGARQARVLVNGSQIAVHHQSAITGDTTVVIVWGIAEVAVGDVITIEAYQNSGGALSIAPTTVGLVERRGGAS